MRCRLVCVLLAAALMGGLRSPAHAYEFEVRAQTVAQGYELEASQLGGKRGLARRRIMQSLSLNIWDLAGLRERFRLSDSEPLRGPRVYVATYMRIEHDFGDYTTGRVNVNSANRFDAVDLIPELEASSLGLDVLYAFAAADGLWGDRIDVRIGRQLSIDTLDWFGMDGLTVRGRTPWHVEITGFGGLRVRETSLFGASAQAPDGTAQAECQQYVEGMGWLPIDQPVGGGVNPFTNEFDRCPQEEQQMPTFGGSIETFNLPVVARVGYRRTISRTPGPLRNDQVPPDVGFYPNEAGQAPGWGVSEERIAASVRVPIGFSRGRGQVTPYAAARYSALHGLFDEAHAGVRTRYGAHSIESEVFYLFPTFDGDSIFNVFSSEPYVDARTTYDLHPQGSLWRGYARGWLRRYSRQDAVSGPNEPARLAAGGQLGLGYAHTRRTNGRVTLFHEDGYGGRRSGGFAGGSVQVLADLRLSSRASVIRFDEDLLNNLNGTALGVQLGATYLIHEGVAATVVAEQNSNRINRSQFRIIGVLDFAFTPEL